jgi:hypothetical protein
MWVSVSSVSVWRALNRSGYSMKVSSSDLSHYAHSFVHSNSKLTQSAIKCSAQKHTVFTYKVSLHYTPEQLVFVDESSCNHCTSYWGHVRAIHGQWAVQKAFFVWCKRWDQRLWSSCELIDIITGTQFLLPSLLMEYCTSALSRGLSITSHLPNSLRVCWCRWIHSHSQIQ